MAKSSAGIGYKTIAENRKARHDYQVIEKIEAGIVLTGTEVKGLRSGKANIAESYATEENGEIFLINANIPEYGHANRFNHNPRRTRKLLFNKRQVSRLIGEIQRKGRTLVPLKLYFNPKGLAKLELAVAEGRKAHDKRQVLKERDWNRQKSRLLRNMN